MKENYNLSNYNSIEEKAADILSDAKVDLLNLKVKSRSTSEIGTITEITKISVKDNLGDFVVVISFENGGIKTYLLNLALSKSLDMEEESLNKVNSYKSVLEDYAKEETEVEITKLKVESDLRRQNRELLEQQAKELKEQIRRETKIRNELEKLNNSKVPCNLKKIKNFYHLLGWMTAHVSNVTANMPDYLERWFDSRFSEITDAKNKRVVDSKKKTVGGFSSQWGLSMMIRFKCDEVPAQLSSKVGKDGKSINNVDFVWDLVENYGFKFTKKQDIDRIMETIPAEHLEEFKLGLTA